MRPMWNLPIPHTSALEFFYEMGEGINLLVTRTFSKVFGLADVRLGYCVGSVEAIFFPDQGQTQVGNGDAGSNCRGSGPER